MKKSLPVIVVLVFIFALVAVILILSKENPKDDPDLYDGTIECDEVDVSSKIPGRLLKVLVDEGDMISAGDLLAVIETKEIDAKLSQAENTQNAAGAVENKAYMASGLERSLLIDEYNGAKEKYNIAQAKYDLVMNATRPEVIREAEANYKAKKAALDMAKSGARPEQREMAKINYDISVKAADTAKSAYGRVQKLYEEGVISKQKEEEAQLLYESASAKMNAAKEELDLINLGARDEEITQLTQAVEAAKATLDMAHNGARQEQKAEARAALAAAKIGVKAAKTAIEKSNLTKQDALAALYQKNAAASGVQQVKIAQDDAKIYAPIGGFISARMSDTGELISVGYPIFTISKNKDYKVKVYVPETKSKNAVIGKAVKVYIPALDEKKAYRGYINKISMAADFATKVATNQQGSFDLRYVEVTVKLADSKLKLKNGITARIEIKDAL